MGNPPFEDVSPIKMVVFHCYVSLPKGNYGVLYIQTMVSYGISSITPKCEISHTQLTTTWWFASLGFNLFNLLNSSPLGTCRHWSRGNGPTPWKNTNLHAGSFPRENLGNTKAKSNNIATSPKSGKNTHTHTHLKGCGIWIVFFPKPSVFFK